MALTIDDSMCNRQVCALVPRLPAKDFPTQSLLVEETTFTNVQHSMLGNSVRISAIANDLELPNHLSHCEESQDLRAYDSCCYHILSTRVSYRVQKVSRVHQARAARHAVCDEVLQTCGIADGIQKRCEIFLKGGRRPGKAIIRYWSMTLKISEFGDDWRQHTVDSFSALGM